MAKRWMKRPAAGALVAATVLAAMAGGTRADKDGTEILEHPATLAPDTMIGAGGDASVILYSSFFSFIPPEDPVTLEDIISKPYLANNLDLFRWEPGEERVSQFTATANIENAAGDANLVDTRNDEPAVESRTFRVFDTNPRDSQPLKVVAAAFRSNADQDFPGPTVSIEDVDPRVAALGDGTIYVWDSQKEEFFSVFEFILTPVNLSLGQPSIAMTTRPVMERLQGKEVTTGVEIRDLKVVFSGNANPSSDNFDGNDEIFLWSRKAFLEEDQPVGGGLRNGGITQVTHTVDGSCWSPAVNRRGEIAFLSDADITGGNPDGSVELFLWRKGRFKQLTNITSGTMGAPRWSANGRTLVFAAAADIVRSNPDESSEIFVWNRNRIRQVTEGTFGASTDPTTDDRGREVAFLTTADLAGVSYPTSAAEIVVVDRNGKRLRQATSTTDGETNEGPILGTKGGKTTLTWVSSSNFTGKNSNNSRRIYRMDVPRKR